MVERRNVDPAVTVMMFNNEETAQRAAVTLRDIQEGDGSRRTRKEGVSTIGIHLSTLTIIFVSATTKARLEPPFLAQLKTLGFDYTKYDGVESVESSS